eukprot:TRINITY_DN25529_c0_g1_i1.p1 TRINITY_DN25529_c0_g1~~TRINITY_DN25529_c0_g1_i1.p1  ORF type:complete len:288 (-),score=42.15 TRINITY_DN25529_c0_g1_i1:156-1019(-)
MEGLERGGKLRVSGKLGVIWTLLLVIVLFSVEVHLSGYKACDAPSSRTVRDFLKSHIYPLVDEESPNFNLSTNCPFHPDNDRNIKYEKYKRVPDNKATKWRCTLCRSTFNDENTIEFHLENAHHNESEIRKLSGPICFGDYCDIFQCPLLESLSSSEEPTPKPRFCSQKAMDKLKYQCDIIMNRCFPDGQSPSSHRLNLQARKLICDKLSCNSLPITKPPGWRVWTILWVIAACLTVMGVLTFYCGYCALLFEDGVSNDIKALRMKRQQSTIKAFWNSQTKRKAKGY